MNPLIHSVSLARIFQQYQRRVYPWNIATGIAGALHESCRFSIRVSHAAAMEMAAAKTPSALWVRCCPRTLLRCPAGDGRHWRALSEKTLLCVKQRTGGNEVIQCETNDFCLRRWIPGCTDIKPSYGQREHKEGWVLGFLAAWASCTPVCGDHLAVSEMPQVHKETACPAHRCLFVLGDETVTRYWARTALQGSHAHI